MPRVVAWKVLQAVASGAYADAALNNTFNKYPMKGIDKSLSTEISYGAIRQRKFLDSWIDSLAKKSATKQPPKLRWLLHVGLYQILKMEKIPVSAVVNTTVELAKQSELVNLSPVVNGILRTAIRFRDSGKGLPLKSDFRDHLAQQCSIPTWLAKDLIDWRGKQAAEIIANAINQSPLLDLRVNQRLSSVRELQELLYKSQIQSSPIENCSNGLQIISSFGEPRQWPGYLEGYWSVQDRSSQGIAPLLEANPGEKILDTCAAPGGKTTHIAELINDQGEVWAVDRSPKRLQKVVENATRLGLSSIKYCASDALTLLQHKPQWKGFFDKILVDAPCSGLGTLARNPDARWRMNPQKVSELTLLQSKLLQASVPLLREGGRIVYSTCTICPEENSSQVEKFIQLNPDMKLKYERQIWPGDSHLGDGFYAAVMDLD